MARNPKALPTVKLERHPHRDARERLRQAYQLLIEAHRFCCKKSEETYVGAENFVWFTYIVRILMY